MEFDGEEENDQSPLQGKFAEEIKTYEQVQSVEKKKKKKKKKKKRKKKKKQKKEGLEEKKEKHLMAETLNEDKEENSQMEKDQNSSCYKEKISEKIGVGDESGIFHQRLKKHQKCESKHLKDSGPKIDWKRKRLANSDSSDFLALEVPKKRYQDQSVEEILRIEKRIEYSLTPSQSYKGGKEKIRRKALMQARQARARSQL